jgi:hypothetical protein
LLARMCKLLALMALLCAVFATSSSATTAMAVPASCSHTAAFSHSHRGQRYRTLTSVQVNHLQQTCRLARLSSGKLHYWYSPQHRWTLYLHHRHKKCWQLKLSGPEALCLHARAEVRANRLRLETLRARIIKLTIPAHWVYDLRITRAARACLARHETPGSSHPYTQQQLGGGPYWGKYQYDLGTWQTALSKARAFYHVYITGARRADLAPPQAQEIVTAFAVAHPDSMGWRPWAYCY